MEQGAEGGTCNAGPPKKTLSGKKGDFYWLGPASHVDEIPPKRGDKRKMNIADKITTNSPERIHMPGESLQNSPLLIQTRHNRSHRR